MKNTIQLKKINELAGKVRSLEQAIKELKASGS
jgi:hypothetical protein